VDINVNIVDTDSLAENIDINFYYSTESTFNDTNYIGTFNLASCSNTTNDINCTYAWNIDDNSLAGDYYIHALISDTQDINTDISNQLTITNCTTLGSSPITLSSDTDLCYGIYTIDNPGGDAITLEAHNMTLDCHGATIMGDAINGIYSFNYNYMTIKNCNILDYTNSIYAYQLDHTNFSDNNLIRINVHNREYGIRYYSYLSGDYNTLRVIDSNITNNNNGIYFYDYASQTIKHNDFNIFGNIIENNSVYGLHIPASDHASGHTIKNNQFINNGTQAKIYGAIDSNENYWSDLSPCPGTGYSFTGGSDNSPTC
jgi:hypothetical protein